MGLKKEDIMSNLTKQQKQEILDKLGKVIIEDRDYNLDVVMNWATGIKKEYAKLANLSKEQYELVSDLLSVSITCAIYELLEMFEEQSDWMKFMVKHEGQEYDLCEISEKMGSEIACYDEDGWIQKFSKIGRFVL